MISFSLGLGNGHQGNLTPAPPVELRALFGSLTKPGAGGMPVSGLSIVAGDLQGHWEILAGHIVPTSAGAAATLDQGPYVLVMDNGRVVQITIEPNAYAVANAAEFQTISTAEAFGKTIRVREGAQIDWGIGQGPGDTASLGFATIIGDGDARAAASIGTTGHFAKIHPRNVSDVTLKNLRVREIAYGVNEASGPVSNLTVQQCLIMNTDVLDLNGDYSAAGAVAALGLSNGIGLDGYIHGLRLIDNDIRNVSQGINAKYYDWAEIVGNRIDGFYNDAIHIVKHDPDTPTIIAGNSVSRPFNRSGDADDPHSDGIQFLGYNPGGGVAVPGDSPNNVIEANSFSIGNTRSNWHAPDPVSGYSAGIFLKDITAGKGFSAVIRANMLMKTGYEDIRPQSVKNTRVEYNGSIPREVAEADGGKFDIGETFAAGSNSASNNIARAVNALNGTTSSGNVEVASTAAAWDAVLPNWRLPVQDKYDLPDILGAFQGAIGAAANKGPAAMVSLASGAELSAYSMDATLVPTPALSNPLTSGAGGVLSLAVTTNVDLNPIFWAVVPVGQAASLREIKERRVPNALEHGYTAVAAVGSVTVTGTVSHPAGNYEVVYFQENGWTRQSPVYRTAWTAASASVDLSVGGSAKFPPQNGVNTQDHITASDQDKGWYSLEVQPSGVVQNDFFQAGEASFAIVRLPKMYRENQYTNTRWGLFGNDASSTRQYAMTLYDGQNGLTGRRHKFLGQYQGNFNTGASVAVFSQPWDWDEALVVWYRKNNVMGIDLYELGTGVKLAGPTAVKLDSDASYHMGHYPKIGVGANFTMSGLINGKGWPGELSMYGHVLPGSNFTDTNWQNIAKGADPITEFGGANFRWLRKLDGSTASLAPIAAVTSDQTTALQPGDNASPRVGTNVIAGSHIQRKTSGTYLTVDPWPDGLVHGIHAGETTMPVTFSGKAGGLTGNVEMRTIYSATGSVHKDWTTVGAISGGAWSGVVQLPKSADGWLVAQFRATSDPADITDVREEFGIGWVIMNLGQSQFNNAMHGINRADKLSARHDVTYIETLDNTGAVNMLQRMIPWQQADGLKWQVDQIRQADPNTPVMIMNVAKSGTSLAALLDDAQTSRQWARLQAKLDKTTSSVSVVVMNWGTADANQPEAKIKGMLDALVLGTGAEYKGHSLKDSLRAGFRFAISPLSRHSDDTYGDYADTQRWQVEWANLNNMPVGPSLIDYRIENPGGPHSDPLVLKGNPLFGARTMMAVERALGLNSQANPHYDATNVTRSGNTITIPVVTPNGGALSSPTPAALSNWQVNGAGTGFTAALSGSNVVLTKASGNWSAGDVVTYLHNGETRAANDGTAEDRIVDGVLYEAISNDTLNLGLPVVGSLSGGKWTPAFSVTV